MLNFPLILRTTHPSTVAQTRCHPMRAICQTCQTLRLSSSLNPQLEKRQHIRRRMLTHAKNKRMPIPLAIARQRRTQTHQHLGRKPCKPRTRLLCLRELRQLRQHIELSSQIRMRPHELQLRVSARPKQRRLTRRLQDLRIRKRRAAAAALTTQGECSPPDQAHPQSPPRTSRLAPPEYTYSSQYRPPTPQSNATIAKV